MSRAIKDWKTSAHRGQAELKKTRRQAVVQRSVTMSNTAPKVVDWLKYRAA
jgi:hypothetical protein